MSKKTSPTLIGAFVVGAVALLLAGVAVFGGAEYFSKRMEYVAYFEESTKGLRVGSNVTLNGVKVGYVSDIRLLVDQSTYQTLTEVTMEILPENLVMTDFGEVISTLARRAPIGHDTMVQEAGLRAQLETESFVTGQLIVQLAMRPDTKPVYRGVNSPLEEIPTIPSNVQAVLAKIRLFTEKMADDFDMEAIAERLNNILLGVEQLTNSEDLRATFSGVNQLVNSPETQQIAAQVNQALASLNQAAEDISALATNSQGQIEGLSGDLKPALEGLTSAIGEARATLEAAKELIRGETVQSYQIQTTLQELERAAGALRDFFDYLERNPDALLRGKE